ncbi:cupin domain-containing protein [Frigidibacter sp. MR17.14]|uniref:(R)-mandelonitrile lyase n=1 Tax=Frigidibacter sp. MR17.14 TaxID=3126509 RepID=UPI0030130351
MNTSLSLALALGLLTAPVTLAQAQSIEITSAPERTAVPGNPEWFSGTVFVAPAFGPEMAGVSAGEVTFLPGARTAWHTHPAGQRLLITAGTGWVQERGQPKREVRAGDVVWFPAGVEHWHGAAVGTPMTHFAVQENVDGSAVTWGTLVTDEEYED